MSDQIMNRAHWIQSIFGRCNILKKRLLWISAIAVGLVFSTGCGSNGNDSEPPVVESFTAEPSTIIEGQTTTLRWSVTDATSIRIDPNPGVVTGTSTTVSPVQTTSYTLTASNSAGRSSRAITVTVNPAVPVIANFAADPASIFPGQTSTLSWTVSDATALSLDQGIGAVTGTSRVVSPAVTTTYTLTATNNRGGATRSTSVTVMPPPTLTSDAPAKINHGEIMHFHVTASAPVNLALEYGPAGMNVSPDGEVTWTATLPMFDNYLDVNWCVYAPGLTDVHLMGTVRVLDPDRRAVMRRLGIEIPIWNSGLQVTDLDGDGTDEMLIGSSRSLYELGWNGNSYVQRWVYPFAPGETEDIRAVAARDIDGDKKQEILFAIGHMLVMLDGAERREIRRYEFNESFEVFDIKIADLEPDGALEVICLTAASSYGGPFQVLVLDASSLNVKWWTPELNLGYSIALGNVDADPALEIVAAGGYVYDGNTQSNEWAYGPGFGRMVATGDLDGNGTEEIVGMEDWDAFRGYSAVLKSPIWEKADFDLASVFVTDFDKDGRGEILIGDGQWGDVTAYRYVEATNSLAEIFRINSQDHGVTSIGVGDVDNDGKKEFIWGSGATSSGADVLVIAGQNPEISIEWTNSDPRQLDGPFDGACWATLEAGVSRLLYSVPSTDSGYGGLRLVALDPMTGTYNIGKELASNWNRRGDLDVTDYDHDGIDEAFVAMDSYYDGFFAVYDFASQITEWTSAADVGASASIVHADMNGDDFQDMVAITREGYIYVYDIRNQIIIWKSTGLGSGIDVATADLDGDGVQEILALINGQIIRFSKISSPIGYVETGTYTLDNPRDIIIATFNGFLGIYVLDYSADESSSQIVHLNPDMTLAGISIISGVFAESMHLEDMRESSRNLIIATTSSDMDTNYRLLAVDPDTGAEIWRSPSFWGKIEHHSLHYFDPIGNGEKRIGFGTSRGMYATQ